MFTPTHGGIAFLFRRFLYKSGGPAQHLSFVLGAMIPDVPIDSCGLWEFVKYFIWHPQSRSVHLVKPAVVNIVYHHTNPYSIEMMRTNVGYDYSILTLDRIFHMTTFWLAILAIGFLIRPLRKHAPSLALGAIYFHVFPDWITHRFFPRPYLWPFWRYGLTGIISHANLIYFWIDFAASAAFTVYFIYRRVTITRRSLSGICICLALDII